jgi:hypothetical protein
MKDDLHFLRVARSIATSRGARTIALPFVATAAIGLGCGSNSGPTVYCGDVHGVLPMGVHCTPTTGAGGGATGPGTSASHSSAAATGGSKTASSSAAGTGGAGGGPVGVMVMPDAGHD